MPRIPTYDAPQVEARALPGARQSSVASPSLFNAGAEQQMAMGRGLMNAGTQLSDVAVKMQERENADMLFRAETSLKDDYLKFEQDVRQRKGQNAWGATADAEKWFTEQEKKHSDILENDVQRRLFSQSLTKMRQSAMGSIANYESGERHRSIEESANASIVGSINQAAASAAAGLIVPGGASAGKPTTTVDENGNPVATAPGVTVGSNPIPGIKSDIIKRVQVLADLNGWSPEGKTLEESKHLTNLHKQVIQNLADKDATAAREYFTANKEEISGAEHDAIGKVLRIGETKQAGFQFAERDDIRKLNEQDAVTAARDFFKDEPEKREAAIHEIKTRFAEANTFREQGQRQAADTAWGIYGRTGNLNDVPASVLAVMDGKDYAAMKEHAANKAAGKGVHTDFATYYDLRQMAATNPEAFRKLDLRQYVNKLSSSDLQEMTKLQTNPDHAHEVATLTQQLSNTHNLMKWGNSDREKKGAFDKAVSDAISLEQKQRGKQLSYEERQAVIDRMLIEGDVNGMWPGGTRRAFEVQGKAEAKDFVPNISKEDKQAIVDRFMRRQGRTPTDAEVIQTFKKWKGL